MDRTLERALQEDICYKEKEIKGGSYRVKGQEKKIYSPFICFSKPPSLFSFSNHV